MKKIPLVIILATSMAGCVLQLPAPQDAKPAAPQIKEPRPQPVAEEPVADSPWIDFGVGNGMSYQLKKGSFRFDQDTAGIALAVALGRIVHQDTHQINALQFYVRAAECIKERGTLAMTDVNGQLFSQAEFMFSAGTIASNIAETICAVAVDEAVKLQQQTPKKSTLPKKIESAI
jgi:hypothetical protein